MLSNKPLFYLQHSQYAFPYHYLPHLEGGQTPRLGRYLSWGLEYLTYISFVAEQVFRISPKSLLDIGCGDGRLINLIKACIPKVRGVDPSEYAIAFARAFNPDVESLCADIVTLSEVYEGGTLIEVLEHISDEDISIFMQNVARLITDDGWLIVSVPTVNVPLNRKHYRHYDFERLRTALEPYFQVESHWWLYRRGSLERFLRTIMVNRFCVLNWVPLLTLIWRIHLRHTYFADARTGAHLVCLAKRAKL